MPQPVVFVIFGDTGILGSHKLTKRFIHFTFSLFLGQSPLVNIYTTVQASTHNLVAIIATIPGKGNAFVSD